MRSTKPPIWLLMSATVASQLALTIFLPSMPALARSFDVAYGTAQLTLSVYLFAFAFAQLAVGPLSDSVGRRPVLLGSLDRKSTRLNSVTDQSRMPSSA